jgi:hypothetical protein
MMHYSYLSPIYNGLMTTGYSVAFCGVTDQYTNTYQDTISRDQITCPACLAALSTTNP